MLAAFLVLAAVATAAVALLLHVTRSHARDYVRLMEREARLREQRENLLLNRLAHAYDKPWEEPPPPVDELTLVPDPDEEEDEITFGLDHLEEDEVLVGSGGTF